MKEDLHRLGGYLTSACHRSPIADSGLFRQRRGNLETSIFETCPRGGDCELWESGHGSRFPRTHEVIRQTLFDLPRHVRRVQSRIECRDVVDPRLPRDESLPKGILPDAVGGHDPESGDDYALGFSHDCPSLTTRAMRVS